ncbi:MAG: hypothetical protein OXL68_02285 [Paracoccaceae bacterium]|nr:hypothetical protein [Paracoccaceae bacterium]
MPDFGVPCPSTSKPSRTGSARALSPQTASTSLGVVLELGPFAGNEMLAMLDWLLKRQP